MTNSSVPTKENIKANWFGMVPGIPSFGLFVHDGDLEKPRIKLQAPGDNRAKIHWQERGTRFGISFDPVETLISLAKHWKTMAKAYAGADGYVAEDVDDAEIDLSSVFKFSDAQPSIIWKTKGDEIIIKTRKEESNLGSESILAIEHLAGFCFALEDIVLKLDTPKATNAVQGWRTAFKATDILPTQDTFFDETPDKMLAHEIRELEFYCRRLNVNLDLFMRSSIWLLAEQGRYALGERSEGEPDWHAAGWEGQGIPNLPSLEDLQEKVPQKIRALYVTGIPTDHVPWTSFVETAISWRITDLRWALYFKKYHDAHETPKLA